MENVQRRKKVRSELIHIWKEVGRAGKNES